jgi:two-component system cell cycle response regulator CtrA
MSMSTDLGEEGVDLGKIYDYDIILLDLGPAGHVGLRGAAHAARVQGQDTDPDPVGHGRHRIQGQAASAFGADDYMTKPFHKDELVARIHAIVRRSKGHAQSVITTGDLVVNLDAKTVEVGGQRVHLTGKEYQMLELLSLRKGTTLTKEMFLNHLYGGMDEPELKIIDVFICKLRKKLDRGVRRQELHRNRLGPRLCAARAGENEILDLPLSSATNPKTRRGRVFCCMTLLSGGNLAFL